MDPGRILVTFFPQFSPFQHRHLCQMISTTRPWKVKKTRLVTIHWSPVSLLQLLKMRRRTSYEVAARVFCRNGQNTGLECLALPGCCKQQGGVWTEKRLTLETEKCNKFSICWLVLLRRFEWPPARMTYLARPLLHKDDTPHGSRKRAVAAAALPTDTQFQFKSIVKPNIGTRISLGPKLFASFTCSKLRGSPWKP